MLFISSNPRDAGRAEAFGLSVAWIGRVSPEAMARACAKSDPVAPLTMFKAIRTQMDELGLPPDHRIPRPFRTARLGGQILTHKS